VPLEEEAALPFGGIGLRPICREPIRLVHQEAETPAEIAIVSISDKNM
jgi:hypothetical protein